MGRRADGGRAQLCNPPRHWLLELLAEGGGGRAKREAPALKALHRALVDARVRGLVEAASTVFGNAGRPAAADRIKKCSEVRRRAWPVVPAAQHGDAAARGQGQQRPFVAEQHCALGSGAARELVVRLVVERRQRVAHVEGIEELELLERRVRLKCNAWSIG